jgi:hypothetical protein
LEGVGAVEDSDVDVNWMKWNQMLNSRQKVADN